MLRVAAHKHAAWWLAGLSFIESSFFPFPPDMTLIPMCLAHREKSFRYALICTVSSALGGVFGYGIGYFLFASIGQPIVDFYGLGEQFIAFRGHYNEWGGWIVFAAGLTPMPYKMITIASGVTHMDLFLFFIASLAGRGMRFYLVAALLWKFGAPIKLFIEKYMGLLTIFFFVLLISGFIGLKYLL